MDLNRFACTALFASVKVVGFADVLHTQAVHVSGHTAKNVNRITTKVFFRQLVACYALWRCQHVEI